MFININYNIFILSIILFVLIYFYFFLLPQSTFPADDALILFRYAENLSKSGVISYNIDEKPTEGATDFLWMLILAFLNKIGIETYYAALFLSLISLVGTCFLFYKFINKKKIILFIFLLIFLTLFKTTFSAIVGFSTLFFGFFILFCIYLKKHNRFNLLCLNSLLTCLVRPDGIVFVLPIIFFGFFEGKNYLKKFFKLLFYFILPGFIYFLWRYTYFGFLFPLPFYLKSGSGLINEGSFLTNIKFNLIFTIYYVVILYLKLKNKVFFNYFDILYFLSLFIVPFLFYSKIIQEQNCYERFQYPFLLINLAIFIQLLNQIKIKNPIKYFYLCIITTLLLTLPSTYNNFLNVHFTKYINLYYIAKDIANQNIKGTMVVTEAGTIPYYTRWRAIDAWGLNTPEFTKKIISSDDIKRLKPDLVLINYMWNFYRVLDKDKKSEEYTIKSWDNMICNICKGIENQEYDTILIPTYDVTRLEKDFFFTRFKIDAEMRLCYDKMYHCFFLKKDFYYYDQIKTILNKYSGIPYDIYRDKIRPVHEKALGPLFNQ